MGGLEAAERMREMVAELRWISGELAEQGYESLQVHHAAAYVEWRAGRVEQHVLGIELGQWSQE